MNEVPIATPTKKFATTLALAFWRGLRVIKRASQALFRVIGFVLGPVGKVLFHFFILPIYRLGVTLRLRILRLALPARSLVLFFITNRFLFHAVIVILSITVILGNIQTRQAHAQDVGQKSLLFALATDEKSDVIEEIVRPETRASNSNYLGSATLVGIPHVDFDYDTNADSASPSIIVPGTIAAQPLEETLSGAPTAPRTRTESYVVKENDTISTIAQRFGVNVGTILWNNNLNERQYIRPGDTLRIPPISGILTTIKKGDTLNKLATKYNADAAEIASFNNLEPDQPLAVGNEVVIPGGTPAEIIQTQTQIVVRQTTPREPATSREPTEVLTEPSPSDVPKPPDAAPTASKTKLLWPTSGHTITQYYGWNHTGVDIDGDYSSPIYAAEDGVVEVAGWNSGGYGLMILIDHANGMKTRYGHSSKLFVKAGDTVKQGQVISMMGTTGRSTGTHLHFEVYTKNGRTNPLGFIR